MAMSPKAAAAIEHMIKDSDDKLRSELSTIIQNDGESVKQEIGAHRGDIVVHRATLENQESRTSRSRI